MPHSTEASTAPSTTFTAIDKEITDSNTNANGASLPNNNNNGLTSESIPYWLVNVPRSQWPAECPSFLRDLPPKSIQCLSTPDEVYERQNWETVKEIIS